MARVTTCKHHLHPQLTLFRQHSPPPPTGIDFDAQHTNNRGRVLPTQSGCPQQMSALCCNVQPPSPCVEYRTWSGSPTHSMDPGWDLDFQCTNWCVPSTSVAATNSMKNAIAQKLVHTKHAHQTTHTVSAAVQAPAPPPRSIRTPKTVGSACVGACTRGTQSHRTSLSATSVCCGVSASHSR